MSRFDRAAVAFMVATAAVAVAASVGVVTVLGQGDFFADDVAYSLCPKDRNDTTAVRPSRMSAEARPYTGPGPHHIVGDSVSGPDVNVVLPADWRLPRGDKGTYRLATLELVICAYEYAVGEGKDLGSCTWHAGDRAETLIKQNARYDYHVFEAATGRLVTTITLPAVAGDSCAQIRELKGPPGTTTVRLPAGPSWDELTRRLEPLVTGPVG